MLAFLPSSGSSAALLRSFLPLLLLLLQFSQPPLLCSSSAALFDATPHCARAAAAPPAVVLVSLLFSVTQLLLKSERECWVLHERYHLSDLGRASASPTSQRTLCRKLIQFCSCCVYHIS